MLCLSQSFYDEPLQPPPRPRCLILRKLPARAAHSQHVVTSHDVRDEFEMFGIEGVSVITNVNDICPLGGGFEYARKQAEFINVSQPFARALPRRHQLTDEWRWPQELNLVASFGQASLHTLSKSLHAFLHVVHVVAEQQDIHVIAMG